MELGNSPYGYKKIHTKTETLKRAAAPLLRSCTLSDEHVNRSKNVIQDKEIHHTNER